MKGQRINLRVSTEFRELIDEARGTLTITEFLLLAAKEKIARDRVARKAAEIRLASERARRAGSFFIQERRGELAKQQKEMVG